MSITSHSSEPPKWFKTTRWSVVGRAGRQADAADAAAAMQDLCESYWLPLYSYVRRRGYSAEDAQDLTQDFFARLLEKNSVAAAQRDRGRFRSFLLGSLKNFLSDEWDKTRALKRGGGAVHCSLEFSDGERTYQMEPVDAATPEQIFERRWAITLLERVMQRLQRDYAAAGNEAVFSALSFCLAGDRGAQPYADLAVSLGVSENTVKSMVHRLRARYRAVLRDEIAQTVSSPAEVEEELRYLFEVLGRA